MSQVAFRVTLRMNKIGIVAAFTLFCSSLAYGQASLPLGERESLMANTGIARPGTVANAYYNPSGLAFNRVNKLVGSGTILQSSTYESNSGGVGLRTSSTQALPLAAGTARAGEESGWALSAFTVNADNLQSAIEVTFPTVGKTTGRVKYDSFGIVIGPSYAVKIGENLALGASAFYYQKEISTILSIPYSTVIGADTFGGSTYAETKVTARAVNLVTGALWRLSGMDVGFRFEYPTLVTQAEMESSGHSIAYGKDGANTIISETRTITPTAKTKGVYREPLSVGVGLALLLSPNTKIYSDASYFSNLSYRPAPSMDVTEYQNSLRMTAGVEHARFGKRWHGGVGFSQDKTGDEVYLLSSIGVVFVDKRSDTGLGLYYNVNIDNSDTKLQSVGLLFSSTIKL